MLVNIADLVGGIAPWSQRQSLAVRLSPSAPDL